jgi:hypothetical protein
MFIPLWIAVRIFNASAMSDTFFSDLFLLNLNRVIKKIRIFLNEI